MSSLPEVELGPDTAIVADLHLDLDGSSRAAEDFVRFLDELDAPRLLILGDLFDYWVGPAQMKLAGAPAVLDALARYTARGNALEVAVGNRDFLLDASFTERTGAVLRPAGLIGLLSGGRRALLVHGDELCTLDRGYQRLRSVLRSRPVRALGPRLPLPLALRLARRLRRASTRALEVKPSEEKSMQVTAVRELCARERCELLICGHAHRLRDERLEDGPRWIVLDAFGGRGSVARLSGDGEVALGPPLGASQRAPESA